MERLMGRWASSGTYRPVLHYFEYNHWVILTTNIRNHQHRRGDLHAGVLHIYDGEIENEDDANATDSG